MSVLNEKFNKIFNEIQPIRGFEDVVNQIEEAIYSGELKVGERLPSERMLSEMFKISRSSIREAIRVLEAEKVVEVKKGVKGGAFIIEPNPDQVGRSLEALIRFREATADELAEFRFEFEGQTAFLAAERATLKQKKSLIEISERIAHISNDKSVPWDEFVELDLLFHEEIANASQNQIRVAIMLAIHNVFHKTSLHFKEIDNIEWRSKEAKDIEIITDAICRGEADVARTAMENHVKMNSIVTITIEK
ncbi:FadR/GntR family transcriptional regulator [Peribacillus simplex]|uniref:FadR/GntR family transcriptional regulator n=1 Tax=Peribacillus simplex TaxID=1478 RepID=UPI00366C3465